MTWFLVVLVWLAATPPPTAPEIGLTAMVLLTASSPLWLKYVPWTGAQMTAASYLAALGIALLASYLAGDLTLDRAGLLSVLSGSGGVWTVQQLLYAGLKQWAPATVGVQPKPAPTAKGAVVWTNPPPEPPTRTSSTTP